MRVFRKMEISTVVYKILKTNIVLHYFIFSSISYDDFFNKTTTTAPMFEVTISNKIISK